MAALEPTLPRSRAELIARSHACSRCAEYSYKRVVVRPASDEQHRALNVEWEAEMICGVCDLHEALGIDSDGDIAYVG